MVQSSLPKRILLPDQAFVEVQQDLNSAEVIPPHALKELFLLLRKVLRVIKRLLDSVHLLLQVLVPDVLSVQLLLVVGYIVLDGPDAVAGGNLVFVQLPVAVLGMGVAAGRQHFTEKQALANDRLRFQRGRLLLLASVGCHQRAEQELGFLVRAEKPFFQDLGIFSRGGVRFRRQRRVRARLWLGVNEDALLGDFQVL